MRIILGWILAGFNLYKRHWLAATGWDGRHNKFRQLGYLLLVIFWHHLLALVAILILWGFLATFREFLQ